MGAKARPPVLVVIPAYNEEKNIGAVLDELLELRRRHHVEFDILVVDDCSTDRTGQIASSKGAIVIRHEENLGEEAGIQTGLEYALRNGYDVVIKIDGDGQHRPEDILSVLQALRQGFDLVIGARQRDYEESLLFRLGRHFCSLLVSILLRTRIRDATSGFYGFSKTCSLLFRGVYELTDILKSDLTNNIERLILARRGGLSIREIPVSMHSREELSKCYVSRNLLLFPFALIKSLVKCITLSSRYLKAVSP